MNIDGMFLQGSERSQSILADLLNKLPVEIVEASSGKIRAYIAVNGKVVIDPVDGKTINKLKLGEAVERLDNDEEEVTFAYGSRVYSVYHHQRTTFVLDR